MKKIAVLLSFLLLLAGCTRKQTSAQSVQEHFDGLPAFQAHVKIFSDFGGSALEYELDYAYNRNGSDHLVLTAPEAVSGIEATISGEESFLLQYGGASLDDGMPPVRGAVPADSVYWLFRELRESEPLELWNETVSGTPALALRYESQSDETEITRQVWLTQSGLIPLCAEVYVDGTRALLLTFSDFQETAAPPAEESPAEPAVPEESADPETASE